MAGNTVNKHTGASRVSALLGDPGVLTDTPILEFFGWRGVAERDGIAVQPWRADHLAAEEAGVESVPTLDPSHESRFRQAVVHIQKARASTWSAVGTAWNGLAVGGKLLICGGNELGIKTVIKRLQAELEQRASIVARRAKGRVAVFERTDDPGVRLSSSPPVSMSLGSNTYDLISAAGVFSADAIDPGSRLLLDHLTDLASPRSVFDPGCGIGCLGLATLLLFPQTTAVLADADHRASSCADTNAESLGLKDRCETVWWDAIQEPPPLERCDLVVLNPPFHHGVAVDLDPARAMFRAIDTVLAPGGTALIVANQTLPYERDLRRIGELDQLEVRQGFKLLRLRR